MAQQPDEQTDEPVAVPFWVQAAMSLTKTRRGGLALVWFCLLCTAYCLPWAQLLPPGSSLAPLFLAPDWSWFAIMLPMSLWYWLGLRWMDRNGAWEA